MSLASSSAASSSSIGDVGSLPDGRQSALLSLRASPAWSLNTAIDDTVSNDGGAIASKLSGRSATDQRAQSRVWQAAERLRPLLRWFVMCRQQQRQKDNEQRQKNDENNADDIDDDVNDKPASIEAILAAKKRVDQQLMNELVSRGCILWQIPPLNIVDDIEQRLSDCVLFLQCDTLGHAFELRTALTDRANVIFSSCFV